MSACDAMALLAAGLAVTGAAGVVLSRRTLYAVLWLAVSAIAVAGFAVLYGLAYIGYFHVIIYVGAVVSFLAFTMLMVGEEPEESLVRDKARGVLAIVAALILAYPVASVAATHPLMPFTLQWRRLVVYMSVKYWLPLMLVVIALAGVLIEVTALARRKR